MFLIGGPAFSGKTLLAHLLNQGQIICLDEPDFHNPEQSHRGIPFLKRLFPGKNFPERPEKELTYKEAVDLIQECAKVISPYNLGVKTANWVFIEYAKIYNELSYPAIALVRDIRDVLAEGPLPEWVGGEEGLNDRYRLIWKSLKMFDLWLRYEDLVMNTEDVIYKISKLLSYDFEVLYRWNAESVHHTMFKLDRHDMLKSGTISKSKVAIWKTSDRKFSWNTWITAKMMGY
ncbi:MAG: hypothetical protein ACREOW_13725 [Thermodesulfobacteriota bacterium]